MQKSNIYWPLIKVYRARHTYRLGIAALVFLATMPAAFAQTDPIKTLVICKDTHWQNITTEQEPNSGLTLSGNTLYGTTVSLPGGWIHEATVYSVPTNGGTPTVLTTFKGTKVLYPFGGLTLSGRTLYGTSIEGGAYGYGTVFSVPISGGSPTILASFNGTNGRYPHGGVIVSGSKLYGTTSESDGGKCGTVFTVPITGGTPAVIAIFNEKNGSYPEAGLTLSGRTIYGTTQLGGNIGPHQNGYGTVFSIPITGGTPTVLASFNGANGQEPQACLTLSGRILYGTTAAGGIYGYGTVFSVPIKGGTDLYPKNCTICKVSIHPKGRILECRRISLPTPKLLPFCSRPRKANRRSPRSAVSTTFRKIASTAGATALAA